MDNGDFSVTWDEAARQLNKLANAANTIADLGLEICRSIEVLGFIIGALGEGRMNHFVREYQ